MAKSTTETAKTIALINLLAPHWQYIRALQQTNEDELMIVWAMNTPHDILNSVAGALNSKVELIQYQQQVKTAD